MADFILGIHLLTYLASEPHLAPRSPRPAMRIRGACAGRPGNSEAADPCHPSTRWEETEMKHNRVRRQQGSRRCPCAHVSLIYLPWGGGGEQAAAPGVAPPEKPPPLPPSRGRCASTPLVWHRRGAQSYATHVRERESEAAPGRGSLGRSILPSALRPAHGPRSSRRRPWLPSRRAAVHTC